MTGIQPEIALQCCIVCKGQDVVMLEIVAQDTSLVTRPLLSQTIEELTSCFFVWEMDILKGHAVL